MLVIESDYALKKKQYLITDGIKKDTKWPKHPFSSIFPPIFKGGVLQN